MPNTINESKHILKRGNVTEMGYNFNQCLEKIIHKYHFEVPELVDSKFINSIILDVLSKRCKNKTVAIWGVGKKNAVNGHCAVIINRYVLNLQGLHYLIDTDPNLQNTDFMGYPIIAPTEIQKNEIQIVIIASKGSRKSIKEDLLCIAPQCEYIDIYEELENRGIVIDYHFFSEQNVYTELYRLKESYQTEKNAEKKAEYLHQLIAQYLKIRDFYYMEKYAEEYCKNKYKGYESIEQLILEIKDLLQEMQQITKKRKGDIVMHLIDSLRAVDVYGTDEKNNFMLNLFKAYQKNSIIFTEAYSTGPATYESMIATIKQKMSFEENVYENNNFMFDFNEFELLEDIERKGMPINFYVSKDYLIMNPSEKIRSVEQLHMSEKLWTVLCDMADSHLPTFNFLYYPWEIHFPMLCGFMRKKPQIWQFADVGLVDMNDFIFEQYEDCLNYVDIQFNFYKDFFSDDTTTVFLGDHAQPVYDLERQVPYFMYYNDPSRVSHVAFIIHNKQLQEYVCPKLVSMIDFNKIMKQIISNQTIDIPKRSVIQYQYYNVQNKRLRQAAFSRHLTNYTEGIHCFLSEKYLYVKTATGCQEVYQRSDFKKNIADTKEGQQYIRFVEENFNTSFPDFWKISKEI